MTQVSPAPSITGSPAIRQIPSGNGGNSGFSLELSGPEPPRVQVRAPMPDAPEPETQVRHAVAGTGKPLPDGDLPDQEVCEDSDTEKTEADIAFAWFGMAPPAPEAAPVVEAAPAAAAPVAEIALPEGEAAPLPEIVLPEGFAAQPAETVAADPLTAEVAKALEALDLAKTAVDVAPEAPVRRIAGIDISRLGRVDLPARIELPATSPILQTIAALQPRTGEANPFAAILAAAGVELPQPLRAIPRDPVGIATLTPLNGLEMQRAGVVQAVADVQQAIIDTRRSDWMTSTIERIEALRDSPNSRETSLRLSPDALGKVDVSIRQEGDKIHVRFAAETAAARALLTEAQSRLNDIAEARGLKLGGTTVDAGVTAGFGGQGQSQRHEAASRTNNASAPVSALTGETKTTSDERVA